MSDTTKVRIGLQGARELEIEVDDVSAVEKAFEAAGSKDDGVVWLTDSRGHKFGLAVDKLAFVEIEIDSSKAGIGF